MSDPKEKEKPKFTLPSSLKNMQDHYRNEIQSFAQGLKQPGEHGHSKKEQKKNKSLFKLNPASAAPVSQSIDILRKRSKSQRLESLHAEPPKESFSLMDHYKQVQEKRITERKFIPKNSKELGIDLINMVTDEHKLINNQMAVEVESEQDEKILKPSQPYVIKDAKPEEGIFMPTIFQTPILPCFASEFKRTPESTKTVQEGEGLWKIGRIKVKGKRCELRIGEFLFEGDQVRGEGRAGLVTEASLHSLPDWKNMWILQPHESLFTD